MRTHRSWTTWLLPLLFLPLACAGKKAPAEPPVVARPSESQGSELPPPDAELLALISGLRGDTKTRVKARVALVERGREVTPYLLPLLKDADYLYRWQVVNTLGYIEDPAAIPALVEMILVETNPHPRYRAHWALRNIERKGATACELFAGELEGPDRSRAWKAAMAMAYFRDERALPLVHEKLTSSNKRDRWEAVSSLARVNDERSSTLMEPLVLSDSWRKVRHEAVLSLARICDAKAIELMKRLLEFRDEQMRWRAARGLGDCGDPSAIPALKARLEVERHGTTLHHLQKAIRELEEAE